MRRIYFFEIQDQKWIPRIIRNYITDLLHFGPNAGNIYRQVLSIIKKGLDKSNKKTIIDLCSGSSGGIPRMNEQLKKMCKYNYDIILTDLYPNNMTLSYITSKIDNIEYIKSPVDALKVPKRLKGFRTIFASFHHFQPNEAKKILESAVENHTPIGIFEITERKSLELLLAVTLHPLTTLIWTPFIRPFKLSRIILTYLIPIIPLFYTWDAIISILRSYKIEELRQLVKEIHAPNYTWEMGRKELNPVMHVVYMLGYPKK